MGKLTNTTYPKFQQLVGDLVLVSWGHHTNITGYELKKMLPTQAQLAKCYADAEAKFGKCKVRKARKRSK